MGAGTPGPEAEEVGKNKVPGRGPQATGEQGSRDERECIRTIRGFLFYILEGNLEGDTHLETCL